MMIIAARQGNKDRYKEMLVRTLDYVLSDLRLNGAGQQNLASFGVAVSQYIEQTKFERMYWRDKVNYPKERPQPETVELTISIDLFNNLRHAAEAIKQKPHYLAIRLIEKFIYDMHHMAKDQQQTPARMIWDRINLSTERPVE